MVIRFIKQLNALLAEAEFDRWIEGRCGSFYEQAERSAASLRFRQASTFACCLVGYFEGPRQSTGHRLALCGQLEPADLPGRAARRSDA